MKTHIISFAILIFFLSLLTYTFLSPGHFYVYDENAMFYMTESLSDKGWFDVPADKHLLFFSLKGKDNKNYVWYGLGQSLLATPYYMILKKTLKTDDKILFAFNFFNSIISALTVVAAFFFFLSYKISPHKSKILTIIYAFCTLILVYSKTFYAEPLLSLLLILILISLNKARGEKNLFYYCLTALLCGYAVFTKVAFAPFSLLIIFFILFSLNEKHKNFLSIFSILFFYSIFIFSAMAYNYAKFGNVFQTGYSLFFTEGSKKLFTYPILMGLKNLTFSFSKGIFIYCPILIMFFAGIKNSYKKDKDSTVFFICFILLWLIFYSGWSNWEGGFCFGPRFLLPIIVLFVYFLQYPVFNFKKIAILLCAVSFLIQIYGSLIDFDVYYKKYQKKYIYNDRFSPYASPFKDYLKEYKIRFKYFFKNLNYKPKKRLVPKYLRKTSFDLWHIYLFYNKKALKFIYFYWLFNIIALPLNIYLINKNIKKNG